MVATCDDLRWSLEFLSEVGRKKRFNGGASFRRFQVTARKNFAVLADGKQIGVILKMAPQSRQSLVAHQHKEIGFRHPHRRQGNEAAGAVFDGIATVGRKRLPDT